MSPPIKKILRNFFSVVAGVTFALIIIIPTGLIAGLMSFSDARIPKSQEVFSTLLLIAGVITGCILGGYTTAKISTRKDIIHVTITGIILTFLYALVNNFEFDWRYPDIGIAYTGFIPIVLVGGIIGIKNKRKAISKNSSFPSDTL